MPRVQRSGPSTPSNPSDNGLPITTKRRLGKAFTPSEAVSIASHVREYEAEKAAERKREGGDKGRSERYGLACGETPQANIDAKNSTSTRTRDRVASIVGMGYRTLEGAEAVVEKGTPELVDAMDKRDIPINTAARLATLPPERQREVVAAGRDVMLEESRKMRPY